MISKGSSEGLENLKKLKDNNGDTILSFLQKNAFPDEKWLCVTGHSLGGNLATVAGPWLRYELLKRGYTIPSIFSILTFAAPTSWNKAFAEQYDKYFTNTWRYYNEIDIVPYSATDIIGLGDLYDPPAPSAHDISVTYKGVTVTLAEVFDAMALLIVEREGHYDSVYIYPCKPRKRLGSIKYQKTRLSRKIFRPVH